MMVFLQNKIKILGKKISVDDLKDDYVDDLIQTLEVNNRYRKIKL